MPGHSSRDSRSLLQQALEFHRAGRFPEAKDLYRQSLAIEPSLEGWMGLGTLARQVGALDAAREFLAKARALVEGSPLAADLLAQEAEILQAMGRLEDAAQLLEAACRLRPSDPMAWERLGIARQSLGETGAAGEAYRRAQSLGSVDARLKLPTLVSPIIASREAMLAERDRIEAELDALLAEPSLPLRPLLPASMWPNFYLAFHGLNDRALQSKFAALYRRAYPSLDYVAPHCARPRDSARRIRVGLISKFFRVHSIGRTSRGLFAEISREEFEVTAIFVAPVVDDEYSRFMRDRADRSLIVPEDLAQARRAIEALELDILFYQDIGMEPFTYLLAFSRLAPVQCVSFGHPDTTGIPAIDYFVSNDLYEPTGAQSHYSERLFLLRGLGVLAYYYRPALRGPMKPRAAFDFRDGDHLYLCPQNLFKFHPDMDPLIGAILRRDPAGKLVVIEGRSENWSALLRRRWAEAIPDVVDRIVFVHRMAEPDYLNVIALADVMLDTLHFNGMNTSLEAMALGTPIVTLPGGLQRGRHTQAMYRKMDFTECIAEDGNDYVDIAVRLGTDRGYRRSVSAEILRRNGVLFEDKEVVREFERFFREAMR